jgi:AcrR family transcriptional regulator
MNIRDSKDRILEVALKVFGQYGYHKTTMADIADAAGRGRRTIYTYFKSKEEIFDAVIKKEIDRLSVNFKSIPEEEIHEKEKLAFYIRKRMKSLYNLVMENEALRRDFMHEYHRVEMIRKDLDKAELKIISRLLEEGSKNGFFNIQDAKISAKSVLIAVKGLEIVCIRKNFNDLFKIQLDDMINIFYHGLMNTKRNNNFEHVH